MMTDTIAMEADEEVAGPPVKTLSICLINPRFEPSYWGFDYALPLYPGDKRSTMISGSLCDRGGNVRRPRCVSA